MNRKDRRRAMKQGKGAAPVPPRAPAPPQGVSGILMQIAGQAHAPIDPRALEIVAGQAATGPVDAAFASLRRRELLEGEVKAIERALAAHPRSVELLLTLAKLHRHLDQPAQALAAYRRVLEADPKREDAKHMIAALSGLPAGAAIPARASNSYVAAEFDGFAERYDEVLVDWLEYRGPEVVRSAIEAVLGPRPPLQDVIDLGCGTGLSAPFLRPIASRLDGVDLSPGMLAKARQRGLYDRLVQAEIGAYLAEHPDAYTLAVAADVLIYFGDLRGVLAAACRALAPGGAFVFTVEATQATDYILTASGRYAHDDAYVRRCAEAAGFDVVRATDEVVRKERLRPVASRCYVLRRPALHGARSPAREAPAA